MTIQRIISLFITVQLILFSPSLQASTQAGECTVVEVNPDNGTLVLNVNFMEYFSGPGEYFPSFTWRSSQKEATPFSDRTMWVIDGRYVHWKAGAAALAKGSHIYHYGSRKTTEFIHIYSHKPIITGALQFVNNDSVEVLRMMLRRYDTDAAVYQRFRSAIESDAQYFKDGEKSK